MHSSIGWPVLIPPEHGERWNDARRGQYFLIRFVLDQPYANFTTFKSIQDTLSSAGKQMKSVDKIGWLVSSSGFYDYKNKASKYSPSHLFDGNQHSFYASMNGKQYHWFQIDFGRTISVNVFIEQKQHLCHFSSCRILKE